MLRAVACLIGAALMLAPLAARHTAIASPRIDTISPTQGPIAGGFDVRISGSGFSGAIVRLDDVVVTPTSHSDTQITLRMPAHANGYGVISIRGDSSIVYGEVLYVPPRLEDLPPGYITTVAGIGTFVRDYGPATSATVFPTGLAFDAHGNLYVAEAGNDRVSRVRTDGLLERLTARVSGPLPPGQPAGDNGPSIDAPVLFPLSIAVTAANQLYIPDQNGRIRRIDLGSMRITTIAGDGQREYSGDGGPADRARFAWPTHIAADNDDVFVVDFSASRIRRINLASGLISTFVGTGTAGFSGDNGPGVNAQFNMGDADSGFLALNGNGDLFIADTENYRIRRVDRRSGVISTFYTLPRSSGRDFIGRVRSLAFDHEDNLYAGGSSRIIKLGPRAEFLDSWGSGAYTLPVEGSLARDSGLGLVLGIAVRDGQVYYTDGAVNRVRRIDPNGQLHTVAGIGPSIVGEEGPAIASSVRAWDIAIDRDGSLLLAEDGRLRRVDRRGLISTVAGTGAPIGSKAPAPLRDAIAGGFGVNADGDGIDLTGWSTLYRIGNDGMLRAIAGRDGVCGYDGDGGNAAAAAFCQAWDSTRDPDGNLIVADSNNNRIRRIDARTGTISTIVGNGGPISGFERYNNGRSCGDGGAAVDACINTPYGVALDGAGNLFLSERPAIRKVDTAGRISTFAPLANTTKLIFDRSGFLYAGVVAGVVRLGPDGRQTFIAGSSGSVLDAGFAGDGGPATAARVRLSNQAAGLAIDGEGNLYFADSGRIRAVRLAVR